MSPTLRKTLIALGIVLLLLAAFVGYVWYGKPSDRPIAATMGTDVTLVEADSETIPSVSLADPVGWAADRMPTPAKGLAISRFADGLDHPRTMLTLPNGDVLVALTNSPPRKSGGGITEWVMGLLLGKVGAGGPSPDKIVLLRDADGDGKAEQRFVFRTADMASPSGMAFGRDKAGRNTLYIANHNAVLAFAFTPGATRLESKPVKLMDLPAGGNHWMRNLLLSADGTRLLVAVGSASNIAENGLAVETGRAAIWEISLETGRRRQYAAGMRNPNGMAWNPSTGELWATVQERDMLGPDLVPDYLTNVPVGAQYGWPWMYWKDQYDERVEHNMPMYMGEYVRKPEYALGAHTGVLGLAFSGGGNRMGPAFANGAFIARHGSWNRKPAVGYDVIFVPFDARGNPENISKPVLTGFLVPGKHETHGRPTWLAWDKAGALLVSDDTAGIIWRVIAPDAGPSSAPAAVVSNGLPPKKALTGDPTGQWKGTITNDYITDPSEQ